jgi:hypothetical protein
MVVVLASLAAGVGVGYRAGMLWAFVPTLAALLGWFVLAAIVYLVGVKVLPEPATKSDLNEILRVSGFAMAPGLLRIFTLTPFLGGLIGLVISIWCIVAMVIGVRQALDYTTTARAVVVVLLGWIAYTVLWLIFAVPTFLLTRLFAL